MLLHNSYINVAIADILNYKFLRPSGAENGNSDFLKTHKWSLYVWPIFKGSNFEMKDFFTAIKDHFEVNFVLNW
jgi:hypothetical protein